jgi:hypothetical protein
MIINKKLLMLLSVCLLSNVNAFENGLESPKSYGKPLTHQEIQSAFDQAVYEIELEKEEDRKYEESSQRTISYIKKSLKKARESSKNEKS